MANREKGEVSFQVGDAHYTLCYTANSLCELETLLDRGVIDIIGDLNSWAPPVDAKGKLVKESKEAEAKRSGRIRLTLIRALLWAGLRERHPDLDIKAAGALIPELGGLLPVANLVTEGIGKAFPSGDGAEVPPRKPGGQEHGTGPAS